MTITFADVLRNNRKKKRFDHFKEKLDKEISDPSKYEKYIKELAIDYVNGLHDYYDLNDAIARNLLDAQDFLGLFKFNKWISDYTKDEEVVYWEVDDILIHHKDVLIIENLFYTQNNYQYIKAVSEYDTDYILRDEPMFYKNISYLYRINAYENNPDMIVDDVHKVCYIDNPYRWRGVDGIVHVDYKADIEELINQIKPKDNVINFNQYRK